MSITAVFERVKSRDINWRRVFFVGVFVALFLEFYLNFFGTVNSAAFSSFQNDSEGLVLGRIQASITAGVFSVGGFLTRNGVSAYTSQFGLQGDIFGFIAQFLSFLDVTTIYIIFRGITAALTALAVTLIIRWLSDEFDFKRLLLIVLPLFIIMGIPVISHSYQFIGMARNLYWVPFTFLLPLLIMIFINKDKETKKGYPLLGIVLLFLAVLGKCLCGFEYISTILIAGSVPLFYYAVKNQMKIRTFLIRFTQYAVSTLSGFVVSVGLYCLKLYFYLGEWNLVFAKLIDSVAKRTYGFDVDVAEVYAASLATPVSEVINIYLVPQLKIFLLILLIVAVCIGIIQLVNTKHIFGMEFQKVTDTTNRKLLAGLCATGISFLAPLSWIILAKGHSYIHTHMNYNLWWVPFIIIGLALAIYFVKCWVDWHVPEKSKPSDFVQRNELASILILLPLGIEYFIRLSHLVHFGTLTGIVFHLVMVGCILIGMGLLFVGIHSSNRMGLEK